VSFAACCGWFSRDSSSGALDTRHCLLVGRSIGEGEVGWSIWIIKMYWITSCAGGPFIADNSRRGCCYFYLCFLT
ncbi:unnamed protein product, partial [Penicillium nalgiovense]